jgi:hypothetical protein
METRNKQSQSLDVDADVASTKTGSCEVPAEVLRNIFVAPTTIIDDNH